MRYAKPLITTTLRASATIQGVNKIPPNLETDRDPISTAAYEADE